MPLKIKLTEKIPDAPKMWKATGSVTSKKDNYIARAEVVVKIDEGNASLSEGIQGKAYSYFGDEKITKFTGNISIPFSGVAKPGRNLEFSKFFASKEKK